MTQKTGLLLSDYYGRLLVAVHCVELIDAGEFGGEGPVEIRVEVGAHPLWDDLVEVRRDSASRETVHGWQVKNQRTGLDKKTMAAQLRALAFSPLHMAHLALHNLEPIRNAGSLSALAGLCERLRLPQFDVHTVLEGMPAAHREWIDFAKREVPLATDEACLELFRRLEVRQLGPADGLRAQALKDLRRWYEAPQAVLESILDFLARHPDEAVPVTYPLLKDKVLRGHAPSLRRGSNFMSLREQYLREWVQAHERLAPLRTLVTEDDEKGPIRMADVFVPPILREDRTSPPSSASDPEASSPQSDEALRRDPRARWTRLLHQQRALAFQRRTVDVLEWLRAPEKFPSRVLLIEGAVGSGKTLLLEHLQQALAWEGLQNPEAPLPILFEAQDLSNGDLVGAFRRRAPWGDAQLLTADSQKRIYFIDGLDEVAPYDVRNVVQCLDQLNRDRNTVALFLAGRPTISEFRLQGPALRLRIAPWTEQDIEQFLERWHKYRPQQVSSLGNAWRSEPMRSAMAHPLTATFSLLLADQQPASRNSRTALFEGIVSKLVKSWTTFRKARGGPGAMLTWAELSKPIRALALEVVRSDRETLEERDLRKFLQTIDPDRDQDWMDAASQHFGLLVRHGRNEYRFILRGIAEYLAGEALYHQGAQHILAAARERWAEEPIRHAIGITAARDGLEAALALLRRIIPTVEFRYPGELVAALRPLLIATRVALDLGPAARPIAETLATPLLLFLTLATSSWIPERVSEAVRELARAGSPCWDALFPRLNKRLIAPGTFASWLAQQPWDDKRRWLRLLSVSDPHARNAVTARLGKWVDDPEVRDALVRQLFDDKGESIGFDETVAPITAGLALRKAARDEQFTSQVHPTLIDLMKWKNQLVSGSAALALRPGEAAPELLVEALRTLDSGYRFPTDVMDELAASSEGRAALDADWPDWAQSRARAFQQREQAPSRSASRLPPLPSSLRPVALKAMGPMLARMPRAQSLAFGSIGGMEITSVLCEEASDHPQGVISVLTAASDALFFHVEAQLALREAASRHPDIARALLELWKSVSTQEQQSRYPGIALDLLVAAGDEEAARAFAVWLERTPIFSVPTSTLPFSAQTLRHPVVLPAALARCRAAWRQHFEIRLWMGTVATCLGSLRPAWEDDAELNEALRQRAPALDDRSLSPLLDIFDVPLFPEWLRELVVTRLKDHLKQPSLEGIFMLPRWLDWVERTGDAVQLRPQLEDCVERESWERYSAATLLLGMYSSSEASALSQKMASEWPAGWSSYAHTEAQLARLVAAHPQSWHARLNSLLGPSSFGMLISGVPLFELVRALLPRLTVAERTQLLVTVGKRLGFDVPWLPTGQRWGYSRRPADFFHELSFDSGAW